MSVQPTEQLARELWALGDIVRLKLLERLPVTPDCGSGANVSELAHEMGITQPTMSHHLRVLRQAGFVDYNKQCRDCFYWRNPQAVEDCARRLVAFLGPETPSLPADPAPASLTD